MIGRRFLDTNILLYSISRVPGEKPKLERALSLLEADDWTLSVQVLQEFYVQATRANRADRIEHGQATALIESWLRFRVQELTVSIMLAALKAKHRYQISYWDAVIIEAARAADCRQVYSEDLSTSRDYDGIRVINPFV